MDYLRRLHGEPYEPLHPALKELLEESYGILVYQEDVVQAAMVLAGFTWGEADGLRKVISKKSRDQLSSYRQRFAEGCARNGVSREVVDKVWDMFTSFSGYSFCKPHSASYALVSFKSAYLKLHYPAEFMAAVITNGGGYYSTFAYISEARRLGLTVKGPDINKSLISYTGKGKTVRTGFRQLQNIRRSTVEEIIAERQRRGPFISLRDFAQRVPIHASEAAMLTRSGTLDSISGGLNRPRILWFLESWLNRSSGNTNNRDRGSSPSGAMTARGIPVPKPEMQKCRPRQSTFSLKSASIEVPPLPDFTDPEKWEHEWETLGFILSVHPLDLAESFFRSIRRPLVPASDFAAHVGRKVWVKGWPITRKEVSTREGEEMEFFTFEDKTGIFETVFFPTAFRRFCQDLDMSHAYLLQGRVESEFDVVTLNVDYACRVPDRSPP